MRSQFLLLTVMAQEALALGYPIPTTKYHRLLPKKEGAQIDCCRIIGASHEESLNQQT